MPHFSSKEKIEWGTLITSQCLQYVLILFIVLKFFSDRECEEKISFWTTSCCLEVYYFWSLEIISPWKYEYTSCFFIQKWNIFLWYKWKTSHVLFEEAHIIFYKCLRRNSVCIFFLEDYQIIKISWLFLPWLRCKYYLSSIWKWKRTRANLLPRVWNRKR